MDTPWEADFSSSFFVKEQEPNKQQQPLASANTNDWTGSTSRSSFSTQFSAASSEILRKSVEDLDRRAQRRTSKKSTRRSSEQSGGAGGGREDKQLKKKKSKKKKKNKRASEASSSSLFEDSALEAAALQVREETEGGQSTDELADDNLFSSGGFAAFESSTLPPKNDARLLFSQQSSSSQAQQDQSARLTLHSNDSSASRSFRSGSANEKQTFRTGSSSGASPRSQSSHSRYNSRSKYSRADSGLSDITFDVNDFQSPYQRNPRQGSSRRPPLPETIAEERKRRMSETSDLKLPLDSPGGTTLASPGGTITDQTIQTLTSKLTSAEGSSALDTNASSGDTDKNWESFVHLGRKITTRRKSDIILENELEKLRQDEEEMSRLEREQEEEEALEVSVQIYEDDGSAARRSKEEDESESTKKPFGFDLNGWSDFVTKNSPPPPKKKSVRDQIPMESTENWEMAPETDKHSSYQSSFHSSRQSFDSKQQAKKKKKRRKSRRSSTSEVEPKNSTFEVSLQSFKSIPETQPPQQMEMHGDLKDPPPGSSATHDLEKWEEFSMTMDDLCGSASRGSSTAEGSKWEAFPQESFERSIDSAGGGKSNGSAEAIKALASIPSHESFDVTELLKSSTNQDAANAQAKKILEMYLKSMGTSERNASAIAESFVQQNSHAVNGSSSFLDKPEFMSGSQQVASNGDSKAALMSGRGSASVGSSGSSQISAGPRRTRRNRPPELRWERAGEPGAVQMEGRAFGAPRRTEDSSANLMDEEVGTSSNHTRSNHNAVILEAKAVEEGDDKDDAPVVYADSSPLSPLHLIKERSIRRILCVACFIIAGITAGVTVAVTRNTDSDDLDEPSGMLDTLDTPTMSPSSQPTFVRDDVLDVAAFLSGREAVDTVGSPQRDAVGWLSTVDLMDATVDFGPAFVQRYAMAVIFFATGGRDWDNPQLWLNSTIHECDWSTSIFCTESMTINGIDFTENNLRGTFPSEVAALTDVEFLRVSKNKLAGALPADLWSMPKLVVFDASENAFTGTLPIEMGEARSIRYMDLSKNSLNGTIPDELFGTTTLALIDVSENALTGTIPASLGDNPVTSRFSVQGNNLSGPIPDFGDELGVLANLTTINLDNNGLTGTLPVWVTGHVTREEVTVSGNRFTGTLSNVPAGGLEGVLSIPMDEVVLRVLDFSDNQLSGEVPLWGAWIPSLEVMRLGKNNFTGPLPFKTTGSWRGLKEFDASHNFITGTVSEVLPENLELYDISNNNIQGTLPQALCDTLSLENVIVSGNSLSGPIAPFLLCRDSLKVLEASDCQLTGTLPLNLPADLHSLDLTKNALTGELPFYLPELTELKHLILASNQLTGSIAAWIVGMRQLQTLDLRDNDFQGTLPVTLGEFSKLKYVNVSGNERLEGSVPPELCTLLGNVSHSAFGCGLDCECCYDDSCNGR